MENKLLDTGVKQRVALANITADPNQPRKDLGDIQELARQIDAVGLIQPPLVRPTGIPPLTDFIIIAGERRVAAMRLLGWEYCDVLVHDVNDPVGILSLQVMENRARKDMNVLETARGYATIRKSYPSNRSMSDAIGVSEAELSKMFSIAAGGEVTLEAAENLNDFSALSRIATIEKAKPAQAKILLEKLKAGNFVNARAIIDRAVKVKRVRKASGARQTAMQFKQIIKGNTASLKAKEFDVGVKEGVRIITARADGLEIVIEVPDNLWFERVS